jgi:transposase
MSPIRAICPHCGTSGHRIHGAHYHFPSADHTPQLEFSITRFRCCNPICAAITPKHETPRVRGVDGWAVREGSRYGTIVVDLERHCVVGRLEDATVRR